MAKPDMLIRGQWADHWGAKACRGLLPELRRPIERLGQHQLNGDGGVCTSECCKPGERQLLFGGVGGVSCGSGRTVFGGHPLLFELCVLFPPSREGGIRQVKREADRKGNNSCHQDQQDKGVPIDLPATSLVVECMGLEEALGHFTACLVRVIHHQRALRYPVFPKKPRDAQPQEALPGNLGVAKDPGSSRQRVCPETGPFPSRPADRMGNENTRQTKCKPEALQP